MNEMLGLLLNIQWERVCWISYSCSRSCRSPVMIHDGGGLETSERLQHITIWFVKCILAQITHTPSFNMTGRSNELFKTIKLGKMHCSSLILVGDRIHGVRYRRFQGSQASRKQRKPQF